jgi:hypothetical protein
MMNKLTMVLFFTPLLFTGCNDCGDVRQVGQWAEDYIMDPYKSVDTILLTKSHEQDITKIPIKKHHLIPLARHVLKKKDLS